ncbi:MAG TPA: hypothetical protein ENJ68_07040 [Devosia sp.]|nr:hypothetical protein [Devosia sp.]
MTESSFSFVHGLCKRVAVFLVLLLGGGVACSGTALAQNIPPISQQTWDSFSVAQFGVSASVPRYGFVPQNLNSGYGESWYNQNGDITISVFANYWNGNATSFSGYRAQQRAALEGAGADITYAPGGNSWFVFSGFAGDDIFYLKSMTRSNCPVAAHIYFKFPKTLKPVVSPIIETMENSLRLGPSPACPNG